MSIMIAHRGYSGAFPGNTALAFREAAKHASGGAETDIRRTSDGVYVTNHNPEAAFADGTEALVAEHTYAELASKPLRNTKTADDVRLCTFREYLEIMREHGMVCFIELKGDFTEDEVREIFDEAARVYDLRKCILQSFSFENLIRARELFPDLPLMWTYGTSESHWERCFAYGFSIDADRVVLTEEMVEAFHAHGLEVGVWTVNDREDLEKFRRMGVDYIESDVFGGED
ncbi:MAG: hypothetical protein II650_02470 [Clostridia bacterium]|nr:hypothetical protein [Clostridia bacterium]